MGIIKQEILTITVNASGDGSASTSRNISGLLYSIRYIKTDYADGIDFTVASAKAAATETLFTGTNVNASATYAPRMDAHTVTGTAQSANNILIPFVGALTVTVAQGGNAKTGTFVLTWLDD